MKRSVVFILFLAGLFYGSAQSSGKYQIKFLEINKSNSDYGVAIVDDHKLIFTSASEKVKSDRKNYNPRKDLYIGDINYDGEITNVKPVNKNEDSKFNETGISYTADKKTVYFSRNKYVKKLSKQNLPKNQRFELFKASVDQEGNWTNISKLPFNDEKYSSGYPVLSSDNTKLYFASDRSPSIGKTDIFVVEILNDGTYSVPRNLGKNVNTTGEETTPYITEDDILYFSSDGHPGKGKLDVFAVEIFGNTTSEIYQLTSPINSIKDDFAYIVNKDNNLGYFSSNRLQGEGFNDLYAFTLEEDTRPGECFISVNGKVKDKDSKEVISGATVNLYDLTGNLLESISTFDDGTYKFTVSCANEYKIIASNENYTNDVKHIEILEENYHSTLFANLNLSKIRKENTVVESLQPIYYDFDDASIKADAAKKMDKIVKIMKDNPNLIIEASAFTDSRGSNSYNKNLSNRRAKAAVNYLNAQGIDNSRIQSKGFGEEKLINQCVNGVPCDESAHQMNRRTEFNFINIQASILNDQVIKNKKELEKAKSKSKKKKSTIKGKKNSSRLASTNSGDKNEKLLKGHSKMINGKDIVIVDSRFNHVPASIANSESIVMVGSKNNKQDLLYAGNDMTIVDGKFNRVSASVANSESIVMLGSKKEKQPLLFKSNDAVLVESNFNYNSVPTDNMQELVKQESKQEKQAISSTSNTLVSMDSNMEYDSPSDTNLKKLVKPESKPMIKENNIVAANFVSAPKNIQKPVRKEKLAELVKNYDIVVGNDQKASQSIPDKKGIKRGADVYTSAIVSKPKSSNKALNYIEKQKANILHKLTELEKNYDEAMTDNTKVPLDSLVAHKEIISAYKKSVKSLEETGWINVLEYKNDLVAFVGKYDQLLQGNDQNIVDGNEKMEESGFIVELDNDESETNSLAVNSQDRFDREILEENLRVNHIEVVAMKMGSKGKYQKTHNAKKADLIKVSFKMLRNEKVKSGLKEAHIVLQNPKGKVANAKGVFIDKVSNQEKKYTDTAIINYHNNDVDVVLFIERKGNTYEKGVYPVKLFLEGQLVSVANLDLQSSY